MQAVIEQHIEIDPSLRGGKPCIAGTRISVDDVVLWHLRQGQSLEQIAGHYDVSLAALHAAMTYYYDHQAEMDRIAREEEAVMESLREATPSLLKAKLRTLRGGGANSLPSG
jgi:uncharacterized protein (DUF433 family)